MRNHLLHFLLAWFILGSLYLTWAQYIDGHFVRKPITFYVDTQNLQTDRATYATGDTIKVQLSYCRNRTYTTRSSWKLINETVVSYPEKSAVLSPECLKDKWVAIGEVPNYAIPGTHHVEGTTQIEINPLNFVYVNYRSRDFQVTNPQATK